MHAKTFELVDRGWITGLRVDHVDGLREPRAYLDAIAARTKGVYVVVEKILATDERLPRSWATEGTTGYEMLNLVNRLFVARAADRPEVLRIWSKQNLDCVLFVDSMLWRGRPLRRRD